MKNKDFEIRTKFSLNLIGKAQTSLPLCRVFKEKCTKENLHLQMNREILGWQRRHWRWCTLWETNNFKNPEKTDAVRELVEEDGSLTAFQIAEPVNISLGSAESILKNEWSLSKPSARWFSKALRSDQLIFRSSVGGDFDRNWSRWILRVFRWELLPCLLCSPDLAPSDFLFPKLKEHLKGVRFKGTNEAKQTARNWLRKGSAVFYRNGLMRWKHRLEKGIDLDGGYIEKYIHCIK